MTYWRNTCNVTVFFDGDPDSSEFHIEAKKSLNKVEIAEENKKPF